MSVERKCEKCEWYAAEYKECRRCVPTQFYNLETDTRSVIPPDYWCSEFELKGDTQ
jgi:hypothetical protein